MYEPVNININGRNCEQIKYSDLTVELSINEIQQISLKKILENLDIDFDNNEKILCSSQACIVNEPFKIRLTGSVLVIIATNQEFYAEILDSKITDIILPKHLEKEEIYIFQIALEEPQKIKNQFLNFMMGAFGLMNYKLNYFLDQNKRSKIEGIKRDCNIPIRCTIQYCNPTKTDDIMEKLKKIYIKEKELYLSTGMNTYAF